MGGAASSSLVTHRSSVSESVSEKNTFNNKPGRLLQQTAETVDILYVSACYAKAVGVFAGKDGLWTRGKTRGSRRPASSQKPRLHHVGSVRSNLADGKNTTTVSMAMPKHTSDADACKADVTTQHLTRSHFSHIFSIPTLTFATDADGPTGKRSEAPKWQHVSLPMSLFEALAVKAPTPLRPKVMPPQRVGRDKGKLGVSSSVPAVAGKRPTPTVPIAPYLGKTRDAEKSKSQHSKGKKPALAIFTGSVESEIRGKLLKPTIGRSKGTQSEPFLPAHGFGVKSALLSPMKSPAVPIAPRKSQILNSKTHMDFPISEEEEREALLFVPDTPLDASTYDKDLASLEAALAKEERTLLVKAGVGNASKLMKVPLPARALQELGIAARAPQLTKNAQLIRGESMGSSMMGFFKNSSKIRSSLESGSGSISSKPSKPKADSLTGTRYAAASTVAAKEEELPTFDGMTAKAQASVHAGQLFTALAMYCEGSLDQKVKFLYKMFACSAPPDDFDTTSDMQITMTKQGLANMIKTCCFVWHQAGELPYVPNEEVIDSCFDQFFHFCEQRTAAMQAKNSFPNPVVKSDAPVADADVVGLFEETPKALVEGGSSDDESADADNPDLLRWLAKVGTSKVEWAPFLEWVNYIVIADHTDCVSSAFKKVVVGLQQALAGEEADRRSPGRDKRPSPRKEGSSPKAKPPTDKKAENSATVLKRPSDVDIIASSPAGGMRLRISELDTSMTVAGAVDNEEPAGDGLLSPSTLQLMNTPVSQLLLAIHLSANVRTAVGFVRAQLAIQQMRNASTKARSVAIQANIDPVLAQRVKAPAALHVSVPSTPPQVGDAVDAAAHAGIALDNLWVRLCFAAESPWQASKIASLPAGVQSMIRNSSIALFLPAARHILQGTLAKFTVRAARSLSPPKKSKPAPRRKPENESIFGNLSLSPRKKQHLQEVVAKGKHIRDPRRSPPPGGTEGARLHHRRTSDIPSLDILVAERNFAEVAANLQRACEFIEKAEMINDGTLQLEEEEMTPRRRKALRAQLRRKMQQTILRAAMAAKVFSNLESQPLVQRNKRLRDMSSMMDQVMALPEDVSTFDLTQNGMMFTHSRGRRRSTASIGSARSADTLSAREARWPMPVPTSHARRRSSDYGKPKLAEYQATGAVFSRATAGADDLLPSSRLTAPVAPVQQAAAPVGISRKPVSLEPLGPAKPAGSRAEFKTPGASRPGHLSPIAHDRALSKLPSNPMKNLPRLSQRPDVRSRLELLLSEPDAGGSPTALSLRSPQV